MSAGLPKPPLAHLRVVDLTDLRGALAGRILADLGADVVKVEPPGGDPDRLRAPFARGVPRRDGSVAFLYRHANKRGAVIDLASAAGRRRFARLCARADVLVENLDAADAARLGLTPDALAAVHPHLVHVAIADCGRSGPRAGWRLEALPALAASGALYASGFPDRAPCWLPGHLAHDCAAIVALAGALAALAARERDGRGQTVEVSVEEAALSALDPWAMPLADYARRYPVLPTALPRDADGPALVVPTADGFVRFLAVTPRQWGALVSLLTNRGAPQVARSRGASREPGFLGAVVARLADGGTQLATLAVRGLVRLPVAGGMLPVLQAGLGVVRAVAAEALRGRTRADVLAQARALGLPMVPVNTPDEFVAEPQTRARGYFRATGFPGLGDAPFASLPANLSATPASLRRPAPRAGADDRRGFPARPSPPPPAVAPPEPVLAGIRVVSLGVGAVVPELCRTLAELGADVVKIESRDHPDFLRRLTLEPDQPNRSWMFNDENRGQRSVCLDLGSPRGRDLALRLCARADVVAENRRGGVVGRWGLDWDDVRRVRPDVVYVACPGFGRGGPLGESPAFGPLNAAFAGATWLWNHPDAPYPAGSSLEHPDHLAGRLLAVMVLAALEHRRRTGDGQLVEMAQTEATAYLLGERYLEGPTTGRAPRPAGNAVPWACPHGVYPAAGVDRWCAIAVVGDAAWTRFRRVVGWAADRRLARVAGRVAARRTIDARVARWTSTRDATAIAAMLQAAGVSAMPVQGPDEQRADPHLAARAAIVTVDDRDVGPVRHVGNALRLGRTPLAVPGPAPRLGADTERVLAERLGLSAAEIRRLAADGVCG